MNSYDIDNLAGAIARGAGATPDAPALAIGSGKPRTFALLWEKSRRLAVGLARLGVVKGDRLALLLSGQAEHADAMVACSLLGAPFVSLEAPQSTRNLARLAGWRCKGVIAVDYALPEIVAAREEIDSLRWVIGVCTARGRSTPAQLQALGVRSYAEIAAPDPSSCHFVEARSDTTNVIPLNHRQHLIQN
jgi:acyl-CoA synthetase (AMP-forming)/AMP-acid ligase II